MQVTRQDINTGWRFQDVPQPGASPTTRLPWLPAQVPGHAHLDLQRAGVIPDPFHRLNERTVAWVDETDFVYETTFRVEGDAPPCAYLVFHGLDTVAEITLNGEPLGRTDNAYVPHEFPVSGRLRAGEGEAGDNVLRVVFTSAMRIGRERHDAWDAAGEATLERNWFHWGPRSFVRKPQYQYGWDWGPELLGCGLWQGVELVTVPVARITDWKYDVEFTEDNKAIVTVTADVERSRGASETPLSLVASLRSLLPADTKTYGNKINLTLPVPNVNEMIVSFPVDKPRLWATTEKGEGPALYELSLTIQSLQVEEVVISETEGDPAEREAALPKALGAGTQFIDLTRVALDPEAIRLVPGALAKRFNILPVKLDQSSSPKRLMVAVAGADTDTLGIADFELVTRCRVTSVVAAKSEIAAALTRVYSVFRPPNQVIDKVTAHIGLRAIELIREPDTDGKGESFKFRVNGQDLFIKGANWIPDSSFPGRISHEQLRQRITQARDAGFNMLRIWGGGLYESEDFYDLCDELGILVWQDFPYACAYYPDTGEYAEAARVEAVAAVRRIRNHPCLALWCGNNENDTMFHDGWGGSRPPRYLGENLYQEILPAVVAAEDPKTPYWPSSPYGGTSPNDENVGDVHNWDVWHGRGDWVHYTENDARFCSEFGFASSCGMSAWGKCLAPEDKHPHSAALRWHDKTRKGYDTYLDLVSIHFPEAQTLEDLVYYTQINQAEALKYGVEHYRRRKGRCWGTLFWQINDCWPTQSWAIIDSEGEPKAAYYACKKFYAPVLLSLVRAGAGVTAHLVNDLLAPLSGVITWTLTTFDGDTLHEETARVSVEANAATVAASFELEEALGQERDVYGYAQFASDDGAATAENFLLLAEPKDLRTADPGLTLTVAQAENGFEVTVTAKRFAPYVWLKRSDDVPLAGLSDNFFHLQPGETRTLTIAADETLKTPEDLRGRLMVRWL